MTCTGILTDLIWGHLMAGTLASMAGFDWVEHRAQGVVIGISENSGQSNLIFEHLLCRDLIRLTTTENSH